MFVIRKRLYAHSVLWTQELEEQNKKEFQSGSKESKFLNPSVLPRHKNVLF
jgi:hypothetical protein